MCHPSDMSVNSKLDWNNVQKQLRAREENGQGDKELEGLETFSIRDLLAKNRKLREQKRGAGQNQANKAAAQKSRSLQASADSDIEIESSSDEEEHPEYNRNTPVYEKTLISSKKQIDQAAEDSLHLVSNFSYNTSLNKTKFNPRILHKSANPEVTSSSDEEVKEFSFQKAVAKNEAKRAKDPNNTCVAAAGYQSKKLLKSDAAIALDKIDFDQILKELPKGQNFRVAPERVEIASADSGAIFEELLRAAGRESELTI